MFFGTFKIKIKSQDLEYWCTKDQDHIKIYLGIQNPCQVPPASCKAQNQDLKDMDVLCTFKIKTESQDFDHGCTKDLWKFPNHVQDDNPQSGTSSIIWSPKSGPKGHACSLNLQNQDREPKFGICVYQRPLTISKSRSRFQTQVRYLRHSPEPQSGVKGQICSLHLCRWFSQPQFDTWMY